MQNLVNTLNYLIIIMRPELTNKLSSKLNFWEISGSNVLPILTKKWMQ